MKSPVSPSTADSQAPAQAGRRAPTRRAAEQSPARRSRFPLIALILISLVAGMFLGAQIMRRRHWLFDHSVLVSVNGVNITKDVFYKRLETAGGSALMREMVREELQVQFARDQHVAPTEQQIEERYTKASKEPGFEAALERRGQTPEEYKRALRVSMSESNVLTQGLNATEAEARKYYAVNINKKNPKASYFTPEIVRIAAIVTPIEEDAKKALSDLNKGISFPAVAQTYSRDRSKNNGGLMPALPRGRRKSANIPGMEDAIFGMKINDQIGPRKFAGAWWIIRCVDKKEAVVVPFEKVRDECFVGAKLSKSSTDKYKGLQAEFERFQKRNRLQAFRSQYRTALDLP